MVLKSVSSPWNQCGYKKIDLMEYDPKLSIINKKSYTLKIENLFLVLKKELWLHNDIFL